MKKQISIVYHKGTPTVRMGVAGEFKKGVPKDVDEDIAERLLAKESVKFERAGGTSKKDK